MFKYFEDYVVAGAAVYGLVKVIKAGYKAHKDIQEIRASSSNEWDALTNKRYRHVGEKLSELDGNPKARCEAFKHCHMLIEKEIEFYERNAEARTKALEFNNQCLNDMLGVWAAA